jgi:hypothetical protein
VTRTTTQILDAGDRFPMLEGPTLAHGEVELPGAWAGGWGVLLIYRGHF